MQPNTFESLRVWQDARRLTSRIYQVTRQGLFIQDFWLRDQICGAAVSVMSNVAEGYEGEGTTEFVHFLKVARGSAAQIRSQLYAAQDIGYLDEHTARDLRDAARSISRQICALAASIEPMTEGAVRKA